MLNIGIIGLGLIGGSLAKSLKLNTNHKIFAFDLCSDIIKSALSNNSIDAQIDHLNTCDVVILALYPLDTIKYIQSNIKKFKKNAIIIDTCGVKQNICSTLSILCHENNLNFIGGHPMAGLEKSGFAHSNAHLFDNANMVFCHDDFTSKSALDFSCELFKSIGFGKITISTPLEHDKIIAFTSQLAHVVSNAYVQSEQANLQMGFSGGSYKDLTRVAYLNEFMWSELFIENKTALVDEIRNLSLRLEKYANYIETADKENLLKLLKSGKEMKENIG